MSEPALSIRNLSKCYQLGQIGRHTLVEECQYWLHRLRGQDPRQHMGRLAAGASATEHRRVEAERSGRTDFWALRDASFDIQEGEIVGVIGRNGAGKSTLLKILSRITEPTAGEVIINGRVGSLLEVGTGFHPELTGRENIFMNGVILGMKRREIAAKFDEIVAFAEIESFLDTPVKRYSSGMYVRLAFAIAAHLDPEILLVDEVLAVGDAAFQQKCLGKMEQVAKQGRTVLFVSHQMAAVDNLCTRCVLIHDGQVEEDGPPHQVIDHYLNGIIDRATRVALDHRTDRSGSGAVKLTSWHLEDDQGKPIQTARSGDPMVIVLGYACDPARLPVRDVDFGISLHDSSGIHMMTVLYGSYQDQLFSLQQPRGEIRLRLDRLPLAAGRYRLGARVTVAGAEADWPRDGIGHIPVAEGDFYGTGRRGFGQGAPVLLEGVWSVREGSA